MSIGGVFGAFRLKPAGVGGQLTKVNYRYSIRKKNSAATLPCICIYCVIVVYLLNIPSSSTVANQTHGNACTSVYDVHVRRYPTISLRRYPPPTAAAAIVRNANDILQRTVYL